MENTTCSICDKEVNSEHCGDCGQKIGRKRTTISTMILDLFSKIVSFEKSVPSTILSIIKNPKTVVNNYMEGNRNYYSNPGALLFWALTVGALHVYFIDGEILGGTFNISFGDSDAAVSAQTGALAITSILLIVSSIFTYISSKQGLTIQVISIVYSSCSFFIILTVVFDIVNALFPLGEGSGIGILALLLLSVWWNARVLTKSEKKGMLFLNAAIQVAFIIGIVFLLILTADGL